MCLFVPVMVLKDPYITDNLHSKNIKVPKNYNVFSDWLSAEEYSFLLAFFMLLLYVGDEEHVETVLFLVHCLILEINKRFPANNPYLTFLSYIDSCRILQNDVYRSCMYSLLSSLLILQRARSI